MEINVLITGSVKGETQVVLRPKNTQQISEIVKHCNDRKIAICPQGEYSAAVCAQVRSRICFEDFLQGFKLS